MSLESTPARRACAIAVLIGALLAPIPAHAAEPRPAVAGNERPFLFGHERTYRIAAGQTLHDIARRFDVGFSELRAANPGVDPWTPPEGTELTIPSAHLTPAAPHRGIVVNLADQRLYLFRPSGALRASFPVGIGRDGWKTPVGRMTIVGKKHLPTWTMPESIRAEKPYLPARVPPGPANPLGDYALYLSAAGIVIHGTNAPDGIGRRVSHGCIRMYPEDIKRLFRLAEVGTVVTVVDQPIKLARKGGRLLLEVHPTQAEADLVEEGRPLPPARLGDALAMIRFVAGSLRIDTDRVVAIVDARRGIPEPIAGPRPVNAATGNDTRRANRSRAQAAERDRAPTPRKGTGRRNAAAPIDLRQGNPNFGP